MDMNDEDKIKKLLGDLPKAPPMSDFENKKFEKFIDLKISELGNSRKGSDRFRKISIAAALLVGISGAVLFSNQNSQISLKPSSNIPSKNNENENTSPSIGGTEESKKKHSETPSEQNQQFSDPGSDKKIAGIYKTGLAYDTSLSEVQKKIKVSNKNLINELSDELQTCANGLENSQKLIAVDSGTYDSEPIYAFYLGANLSNANILITDHACVEVARITP